MAKKNIQARFAEALKARGETAIVGRSGKYMVFTRTNKSETTEFKDYYYYLGKSGSLRIGKTIADSIPVNEGFKSTLLKEIPQ